MSGIAQKSGYWIVENPFGNPPSALVKSVRGGSLIWAASLDRAAGIAKAEDDAFRLEDLSKKGPPQGTLTALLLADYSDGGTLELMSLPDPEANRHDEPTELFYVYNRLTNCSSALCTDLDAVFAHLQALRQPPAEEPVNPIVGPSMR